MTVNMSSLGGIKCQVHSKQVRKCFFEQCAVEFAIGGNGNTVCGGSVSGGYF